MYTVLCDMDLKKRCLKEKIKHIVSLQRFVHRYEQSTYTFSALQLPSSIKTALSQIHLALHTSQLSMTELLKKGDVMESLSAFRLTEKDNRIWNQSLLKLMPCAKFHHSLILTGVDCCNHISCVTLDQVWVGDEYDLILTNAIYRWPFASCEGFFYLCIWWRITHSERWGWTYLSR